jgi:glutamine amidotransferase-like uncharacterized protein
MSRKAPLLFFIFLSVITGISILEVLYGATVSCQELQASDTYALVYNGPASADDCPEAAAAIAESAGLKIQFITDLSTLPQLLNRAAVFIIGGTEDDLSPLVKAFTPEVTRALKDYLRRGGRYLGICGGGFMASSGWIEGTEHMKGLGIIPAESSVFNDIFKAVILPIRWQGKDRAMYFQAGPDFHLSKSPEMVRIVATYKDGSVAALLCSYGKGRVAVCGPHPEARATWKTEASSSERWTSSTDCAVELLRALLKK